MRLYQKNIKTKFIGKNIKYDLVRFRQSCHKNPNFGIQFLIFSCGSKISHLLLVITITVFLETMRFYSDAATNIYTRSLVYNLTLKQIIRLGFARVPLVYSTFEQILLLDTPTNFIDVRLMIL